MKTLYLLRHAKSSWDDATLSDFDRPLSGRGLRAAPFMGGLMLERGLIPAAMISSPAKRARQTAQLAAASLELEIEIEFDDRVYDASAQRLVEIVSEVDDKYASVMLIGHNPGLEGCIRFFTGKVEPMPTAALAVIELSIGSWADVSVECGNLQQLIRPRQVMDFSKP